MKEEVRLSSFEMVRLNEAVVAVNVEPLMPPDWQQQIHGVVNKHGKFVELEGGKVSTSLESPEFTTAYSVVKGPDIDLPWLRELYEGPLQDMVEKVAGKPIIVDPEPEFGININTLTVPTQKNGYELHTDFNDWTALLAVTTMGEGDGGELIHVLPDGTKREISIQAGWVYIFNGNIHAHKVNPLNPEGRSVIRITVPMDFFEAGSIKKRPSDLKAIFGDENGEK